MSLAIKNLNAPLGAEISGLDLSKPIAPHEVMTIEDVWRERLVVVFHHQKLSDPQLIAFSNSRRWLAGRACTYLRLMPEDL